MTPFIAAVLIAQAPLCGGLYNITPDDAPFTGCFIPSWRGDGSGAVIKSDPLLSPSGYRATPVPPRSLPLWGPPTTY
jgi:hypothetical protein